MTKTFGLLTVIVVSVLAGACKKTDTLAGIDTEALFALPTADEINTVRSLWERRKLNPSEVQIEQTEVVNDKLSYQLISFRLYGFKQYAAVLLPVATKPLPVQVYIYGFALNDSITRQNIRVSDKDTLPFIYIVPALRGQSLNIEVNDKVFTSPQSQGTRNDAFDAATDDAIASLNAVAALHTEADTSRVMVRGGSRGGTVALLMAERDKRVKRAVGVAFPAEFVGLTASHQNDPTYKFQFLDALIAGKLTMKATRSLMIASSPIYFCEQLPATQLHFAEKDEIAPPAQGEMIVKKMIKRGLQDSVSYFLYKDRTHDNIGSDNKAMEDSINVFFGQLY